MGNRKWQEEAEEGGEEPCLLEPPGVGGLDRGKVFPGSPSLSPALPRLWVSSGVGYHPLPCLPTRAHHGRVQESPRWTVFPLGPSHPESCI